MKQRHALYVSLYCSEDNFSFDKTFSCFHDWLTRPNNYTNNMMAITQIEIGI